jgi:hypothetical protein
MDYYITVSKVTGMLIFNEALLGHLFNYFSYFFKLNLTEIFVLSVLNMDLPSL